MEGQSDGKNPRLGTGDLSWLAVVTLAPVLDHASSSYFTLHRFFWTCDLFLNAAENPLN